MIVTSTKADELAHRLARLTGEDVQTAVERAIQECLSRVAPTRSIDRRTAILKFIENVSAMPVKDARPIDEIIGFGPHGQPDDTIPSRKPTDWDSFFSLVDSAAAPPDFLDRSERSQPTQERDPFEE